MELTQETGFTVDTDQKAEWAIKAIRGHQEERDRYIAVCEQEIGRLTAEIAKANKQYDAQTAFLRDELLTYMRGCKCRETKTMFSYKLPSGKLKLTKAKPDYKRDPAKLVDWLAAHGRDDLIKVTREPRWAETKPLIAAIDGESAVTEDGEIIDGVTVVMGAEAFEIEMEG